MWINFTNHKVHFESKLKPIMVRVSIDSDSNVLNLEQFTTKDSEPIVQFSIQELNF